MPGSPTGTRATPTRKWMGIMRRSATHYAPARGRGHPSYPGLQATADTPNHHQKTPTGHRYSNPARIPAAKPQAPSCSTDPILPDCRGPLGIRPGGDVVPVPANGRRLMQRHSLYHCPSHTCKRRSRVPRTFSCPDRQLPDSFSSANSSGVEIPCLLQ